MSELYKLAELVFTIDNRNALDPGFEWKNADGASVDYAYDIAEGLIAAGYRREGGAA